MVRFAKRSDANLDKDAAGLGLVPAERRELIHRAGDRATGTGHDIRAIIYKIVSFVTGSVEPRPVVVVSRELEAIDYARPIEARALIIPVFPIRQIQLDVQLAVDDFGLRRIGGGKRAERHGNRNEDKNPFPHPKRLRNWLWHRFPSR